MFGKDRMGAAGVAQKQAICVMDSGGGATPVSLDIGKQRSLQTGNRNPAKPTDYIFKRREACVLYKRTRILELFH